MSRLWKKPPTNINPDPLNFEVKDGARAGYKYIDKIKKYRKTTGQETSALIYCNKCDSSNANSLIRWALWGVWLRWQGNQPRRMLAAKKSADERK